MDVKTLMSVREQMVVFIQETLDYNTVSASSITIGTEGDISFAFYANDDFQSGLPFDLREQEGYLVIRSNTIEKCWDKLIKKLTREQRELAVAIRMQEALGKNVDLLKSEQTQAAWNNFKASLEILKTNILPAPAEETVEVS